MEICSFLRYVGAAVFWVSRIVRKFHRYRNNGNLVPKDLLTSNNWFSLLKEDPFLFHFIPPFLLVGSVVPEMQHVRLVKRVILEWCNSARILNTRTEYECTDKLRTRVAMYSVVC